MRACPECGARIMWRPKVSGGPKVCLEVEPWDGKLDGRLTIWRRVEDDLFDLCRTTEDLKTEPLFVCHTSRPGHEKFARSRQRQEPVPQQSKLF